MKKTLLTLSALALVAGSSQGATLLNETFDDATGFTTSSGFFSDGAGDYLGLTGGTDDFGTGATPSGLKGYTSFTGSYLTGQDLDGEGAGLPIVITWTGISITGETGLSFSGDFAEFFDTPGDIDNSDFLTVEYQIDGGGFQNLIDFRNDGSGFNTNFQQDTDFNGTGDGTTLTGAAQNFTASISGTGSALDLRMSVSVDSGDEDFAVDNFAVSSIPEPSSALLGGLGVLALLRRRR